MRVTDSFFWCTDSSFYLVTQRPRRHKRAGVDPSRHIFPRIFSTPRFVHATAPARWRLKSHRPRATRQLGRYRGARTIRDSPSDVGASHRMVRRPTCYLLFSGQSTTIDASDTSARAARGVHVGQLAPKPASSIETEPRGPSQLRGVFGVARIAPSQLRIVTIRHEV